MPWISISTATLAMQGEGTNRKYSLKFTKTPHFKRENHFFREGPTSPTSPAVEAPPSYTPSLAASKSFGSALPSPQNDSEIYAYDQGSTRLVTALEAGLWSAEKCTDNTGQKHGKKLRRITIRHIEKSGQMSVINALSLSMRLRHADQSARRMQ